MPPYRLARPRANLVQNSGTKDGAALMPNLCGDVREGSV